jgi:hypothetical protein
MDPTPEVATYPIESRRSRGITSKRSSDSKRSSGQTLCCPVSLSKPPEGVSNVSIGRPSGATQVPLHHALDGLDDLAEAIRDTAY